MKKEYALYAMKDTPLGTLWLGEKNGKITMIIFDNEVQGMVQKGHSISLCEGPPSETISRGIKQLKEYFGGQRTSFDLPLEPEGTAFQKRVWTELVRIEYGQTVSYEEIAIKIGKPKACRAVGMANNRNPVSIVIPCHRVIGKSGSLTGYGGGLEKKRILLDMERRKRREEPLGAKIVEKNKPG